MALTPGMSLSSDVTCKICIKILEFLTGNTQGTHGVSVSQIPGPIPAVTKEIKISFVLVAGQILIKLIGHVYRNQPSGFFIIVASSGNVVKKSSLRISSKYLIYSRNFSLFSCQVSACDAISIHCLALSIMRGSI